MFRFLHAADIHLDSPLNKLDYYEGAPVDELRRATRRALDNLVQTCMRENVSFEKSDQDQTIGGERTELSKMDGSARIADIAEENQMLPGRLENDIEQYARLRIAVTVLSKVIFFTHHRHLVELAEKNLDLSV